MSPVSAVVRVYSSAHGECDQHVCTRQRTASAISAYILREASAHRSKGRTWADGHIESHRAVECSVARGDATAQLERLGQSGLLVQR